VRDVESGRLVSGVAGWGGWVWLEAAATSFAVFTVQLTLDSINVMMAKQLI
jgi:hypothetical protein